MKKIDTDVSYTVHYQNAGDPNWYTHTNTQYEHAVGYNATTDLDEAMTTAEDLVKGTIQTTNVRRYQKSVVAAQVYQHISTGGVVVVVGEPEQEI